MKIPAEPFKGTVFDLDGTLIDAFPPIIIALNQTLREFGKPEMTPEAIKRHTGRGAGGIKSLIPDHVEAANTRFLELHDAIYLNEITAIDGAESVLTWLCDRSIPVSIVTSKGQYRAEAQIEVLGWNRYFKGIIGKIDGRPEKPSPVPVRLACEAMHLDPSSCCMIGDGVGDMKAGSSAGLFSVGIIDSFSEEELTASGADLCFRSLKEASNWLQNKIA